MLAGWVVSHLGSERDLLKQDRLVLVPAVCAAILSLSSASLSVKQMFGKLICAASICCKCKFLMANNAVVLRFANVQRQFTVQRQRALGSTRFLVRLD